MTFILALLLAIAVIAGIIAYWIILATLFLIGIVFVFWVFVFAYLSGDPYVGGICAVFATVLTLWLYDLYSYRKKPNT